MGAGEASYDSEAPTGSSSRRIRGPADRRAGPVLGFVERLGPGAAGRRGFTLQVCGKIGRERDSENDSLGREF